MLSILQNYSVQDKKFLFLGDYVDRGQFCIEVITLLMILKIKYPNSVHLLRGNHQSRDMTTQYNFKQQCVKKYSIDIYENILDLFKLLPLVAIVDGKYFCVHGGISPEFKSINQLQKVNRKQEIPEKGVLCDLVWSDPIDDDQAEWEQNTIRGVSYFYSRQLTKKFLKKNNLKMIIRAHQVQQDGYKFQQYSGNKNPHNNKQQNALSLTLFSAPNYCDKFQNKGAIAIIKNNKITIQTFEKVAHPLVLPHYMNVFQWTIPFLSQCVQQIAKNLIRGKSRPRLDSKPLNEITKQLKNYQQMYFIEKLLDMVLIEKNEMFPLKRKTQLLIEGGKIQVQNQEQKQNKLQKLNQDIGIKHQDDDKNSRCMNLTGRNKIEFHWIQKKVLKQLQTVDI